MSNLKIILSIVFIFSLSSCITTPTETVSTVDDRPYIMFSGAEKSDIIFIDDLEVGSAVNYIDKVSALKVEPGTHYLSVYRNGSLILEQKFFVSDGSSKSFVIK